MPSSPTYTFSPNTKIKSSEVNQNFTDSFPSWLTTWTPVVYGADNSTDITDVIYRARHILQGKWVSCYFYISLDSVSAFNTYMSLPVTPAYYAQEYTMGIGSIGSATVMLINMFSTPRAHFAPYTATQFSGTHISGSFTYEAA